jgi:hypothetical protein
MRKFVILFLFLILFTPTSIEADTIVLKNGTRIKVDQTWKEDGQIKCYRFGAVIGYSLDSIDHIEIDKKSEKKSLSTPHEIPYRNKVVVGQSVIYHGNTKSYIFHKPSCRYYNCKNCTAEFTTRELHSRIHYQRRCYCRRLQAMQSM